jgi:uncharacterized protein (TIGR03437 family)
VNYQSSPDALDNTVLNFNPSKANNDVLLYQFYAPIVPGQTWKDPYSELTLSVNKSSAGGVEVSVSFDDLCATITPTTNWFMPLKSAGTIHVTAPSGCSWSAASNVPWISLTSGASGNGAGDVSYTVLPNSGTDYRVGSITIQRRTFAMMQAGTTTVSYPLARPGSLSFTATAGGVAPARQNLKLTATAWPLQLALQPGQPWISLSSTTASTPAAVSVGVVTTGLAAGHYDGWIVAISGSLSWELDVTLDVLEPPGPYFVSAGIVNAASYVPGLIPGSLATLFGKRLSGISGIASAGGATTYSGVTVTVGGVRAPLLNLVNLNGQEQISFQTPFELPAGVTTVELQNGNSRFSLPGVPVSAIGPGLFELSLNGRRQGAVVHQDGSLVTPANPARRGEVVSLYFTGGGPLIPPVPTGALGPVPPPIAASDVLVGVGGSICRVLFAGYAPQALGLYQVNFEIADNIPSGPAQSLQLSSSAVPSQQSTIAIE